MNRKKIENQKMFEELVSGILSILKEQVIRIILYGSVATNRNTAESDIDIAILIKGNLSRNQNTALSTVIGDLNLKYDRVFAVVDINESMYSEWIDCIPFFKNVENEGITLWKAA